MTQRLSRRSMLQLTGAGMAAMAFSACTTAVAPSASPSSGDEAPAPEAYTFKHPSWMWDEGLVGEWHHRRREEFEAAHPGIEVQATQIASADFESTVLAQMAAGDFPDLLPAFTNMLPPLIANEVLASLDSYLAESTIQDRVLPSISIAVVENATYGIPLTMSPQSLLYNRQLLDAAGVSIPTTVEELHQFSTDVNAQTDEWGYGFNSDTANVLLSYIVTMQWVIGHGSDWADADGNITANQPENIEALSWLQRFIDEDLSPKGLDAINVRTLFAEGKVAFLFDGPWVMTQVKGQHPENYESMGYDIMPTPTHAAITGGAFYVVPEESPHHDDAWAYLEIINTPEAQLEWLEENVQIPGTVVEPSEAFLEENPWVAKMVEVAANYPGGLGYAPPSYKVHANEFRQIVMDHVAQAWAGATGVEDALNELQNDLETWAVDKTP